MPAKRTSKSPKCEVCAGLQILAKIISREVVHKQLAKIGRLATDPASADPFPAKVGDDVQRITSG
jgi:hypothetical protein